MAQTEEEVKRQWYETKESTCSCVLVEDLQSATSTKLDGISFFFFCVDTVVCIAFVTEWHIHSQAGLVMNADTVQHGSFGGFQVFTVFFFPLFFSLLQAWVDTTQSTHMTRRYSIYRSGLYREEDVLERREQFKSLDFTGKETVTTSKK